MVTEKDQVEAHLLARNNSHYRQANHTPFANTARGRRIGFNGTNAKSQTILDGTYQDEGPDAAALSVESEAYIAALAHPQKHLPREDRDSIDTTITATDLAQGFSKWVEKTSTSPSGRHLGHYRTFLYNKNDDGQYPFFEILANMLNTALQSGQPPERWLKASSVCLEKEAGNPRTDKIRIIHLYEADLNFLWKFLWGRLLVRAAEKDNMYPDSQYGSRPNRSSIDAVLKKRLMTDYTRITNTNMGTVDNDAMANYDRIVCALSAIACQRLGMPATAELLHNS
jgi:hypothetical protein